MRILLLVLLLSLFPLQALAQGQPAPAATPDDTAADVEGPQFLVSLRDASLAEDVTIMGYDVRVRAGHIAAAPLLPRGWEVVVRNFIVETPPWHSALNATAEEGADGIDLAGFDSFLLVEKDPALAKTEPFTVEVGIITTADLKTFSITWLPADTLLLTPYSR